MTKYEILLKILDGIREEALNTRLEKKYAVNRAEAESIGAARSRAYIHLYLKVMFGLLEFEGREKYITDGSNDGGIDGYFIDRDWKRVYILQSKFRNSETNFEGKSITPDEILSMDIDRITGGHETDANGLAYNGKILQFIRELRDTADIATRL